MCRGPRSRGAAGPAPDSESDSESDGGTQAESVPVSDSRAAGLGAAPSRRSAGQADSKVASAKKIDPTAGGMIIPGPGGGGNDFESRLGSVTIDSESPSLTVARILRRIILMPVIMMPHSVAAAAATAWPGHSGPGAGAGPGPGPGPAAEPWPA